MPARGSTPTAEISPASKRHRREEPDLPVRAQRKLCGQSRLGHLWPGFRSAPHRVSFSKPESKTLDCALGPHRLSPIIKLLGLGVGHHSQNNYPQNHDSGYCDHLPGSLTSLRSEGATTQSTIRRRKPPPDEHSPHPFSSAAWPRCSLTRAEDCRAAGCLLSIMKRGATDSSYAVFLGPRHPAEAVSLRGGSPAFLCAARPAARPRTARSRGQRLERSVPEGTKFMRPLNQ